jgi:hypothetical protein
MEARNPEYGKYATQKLVVSATPRCIILPSSGISKAGRGFPDRNGPEWHLTIGDRVELDKWQGYSFPGPTQASGSQPLGAAGDHRGSGPVAGRGPAG